MAENKVRIIIETEAGNTERIIQGVQDSLSGLEGSSGVAGVAAHKLASDTKVMADSMAYAIGILKTLTAAMAAWGAYEAAKGFIDTAASFERMEVALDKLTKGLGVETLNKLNQWAMDMPVNTQQAIDTFKMMQAMGLDPTIDKMEILVDTASIFGQETLPQIARALGQMATLGQVSAEELNQLSEAGINARKYLSDAFGKSVEELQRAQVSTKEIIKVILDGLKRDFGGAARDMQDRWDGLVNALVSYWTEFRRKVMESDVFAAVKDQIRSVNQSLGEMYASGEFEAYAEKVGAAIVTAFGAAQKVVSALKEAVSLAWQIMASVPSGFLSFMDDARAKTDAAEQAMRGYGNTVKANLEASMTNWQTFASFLAEWGRNSIEIFAFMGKAIGEALATMLSQAGSTFKLLFNIAYETAAAIGQSFEHLGGLLLAALTLDIDTVKQEWGALVAIPGEFGQKMTAAGDAYTESMQKSWDAFKSSVSKSFEDLGNKLGDVPALIEPSYKAVDKLALAMAEANDPELAFSNGMKQAAEHAKALESQLQKTNDKTKESGEAAKRAAEALQNLNYEYEKALAAARGLSDPEIAYAEGMADAAQRAQAIFKDTADKQIAEQERANEVALRKYTDFYNRVADVSADSLYTMFKDAGDGWQSLLDDMYDWFLKFVSQIISQQIVVPLAMDFVSASGLGSLLGFSSSATAAAAGQVTYGADGMMSTGSSSNLTSLLGLTGWSDTIKGWLNTEIFSWGGGANPLTSGGALTIGNTIGLLSGAYSFGTGIYDLIDGNYFSGATGLLGGAAMAYSAIASMMGVATGLSAALGPIGFALAALGSLFGGFFNTSDPGIRFEMGQSYGDQLFGMEFTDVDLSDEEEQSLKNGMAQYLEAYAKALGFEWADVLEKHPELWHASLDASDLEEVQDPIARWSDDLIREYMGTISQVLYDSFAWNFDLITGLTGMGPYDFEEGELNETVTEIFAYLNTLTAAGIDAGKILQSMLDSFFSGDQGELGEFFAGIQAEGEEIGATMARAIATLDTIPDGLARMQSLVAGMDFSTVEQYLDQLETVGGEDYANWIISTVIQDLSAGMSSADIMAYFLAEGLDAQGMAIVRQATEALYKGMSEGMSEEEAYQQLENQLTFTSNLIMPAIDAGMAAAIQSRDLDDFQAAFIDTLEAQMASAVTEVAMSKIFEQLLTDVFADFGSLSDLIGDYMSGDITADELTAGFKQVMTAIGPALEAAAPLIQEIFGVIDAFSSGTTTTGGVSSDLDDFVQSMQDIIDQNTLSDVALQVRELNEWYEEQVQIAEDLGVSINLVNAAYNAQLDAMREEYSSDWQDIIDQNTLGDLGYELQQLNQWYIEQLGIAQALGMEISQLNQAYDLQMAALLNSVIAPLSGINTSGLSAGDIMSQIEALQALGSGLSLDQLNQMAQLLADWWGAATSSSSDISDDLDDAAKYAEQIADAVEQAVRMVDDVVERIKYSSLNVAVPREKAAEAEGDYATLLAAALTGDQTAVQDFLSFAPTYLQAQQDAYKSSEAYQAQYARVMADLEAVRGYVQSEDYQALILEELKKQTGQGGTGNEISDEIKNTFNAIKQWIIDMAQTIIDGPLIAILKFEGMDEASTEFLKTLSSLIGQYGFDSEMVLEFVVNSTGVDFATLENVMAYLQWVDENGYWDSQVNIELLGKSTIDLASWQELHSLLVWIDERDYWNTTAWINLAGGVSLDFTSLDEFKEFITWIVDNDYWNTEAFINLAGNISIDMPTIQDYFNFIQWVEDNNMWSTEAFINLSSGVSVSFDDLDRFKAYLEWIDYYGYWDTEAWINLFSNVDVNFETVTDFIDFMTWMNSKGYFDSPATVGFLTNYSGWDDERFEAFIQWITANGYWDSDVFASFLTGYTGWTTAQFTNFVSYINTNNLWDSDATLKFITSYTQWSTVGYTNAMSALKMSLTATGWQSSATLLMIAQMSNAGVTWSSIQTLLGSYGVTDDTIIKTIKALYDYSGSNLAWADLEMMLETAGLSSTIIQQIKANISGQVTATVTGMTDLQYLGGIFNNSRGIYQYSISMNNLLNNINSTLSVWFYRSPMQVVDVYGDGKGSYALGGIASGPPSGYDVTLHGIEAVIPLSQGYIPVRITDGGSRRGETSEVEELLREQNELLREKNDRPLSITVEVAGKSFQAEVYKWSDEVRVKAIERGVGARRMY